MSGADFESNHQKIHLEGDPIIEPRFECNFEIRPEVRPSDVEGKFGKGVRSRKNINAESLFLDRARELGFEGKKVLQNIRRDGYEKNIVHYSMETLSRPRECYLLAGAIQMLQLYEKCPVSFEIYLSIFREYLRPEIYDFCMKHAEELLEMVNFEDDFKYGNLPANTLIKSYLARIGYGKDPQEIPQYMKLRVSVALCHRHGIKHILKCFTQFGDKFTFATPTIANAGFRDGNPISCIIDSVPDSLEGIYSTMLRSAMSSKKGGGLGIDVSSVRHSAVGRSSWSNGLVPMLKLYDQSTSYAKQSNVREGAMAVSLRISHIDFPDVVQALDVVGEDDRRLKFLHFSAMTCDLFWKRVESRGKWRLFCPNHTGKLVDLHGKEFEELYLSLEKEAETYERYLGYRKLLEVKSPSVSQKEELKALQQEFGQGSPDQVTPREIVSKVYSAFDLAFELANMIKKRGFPYVCNGCSINRKNPNANVGPVRSLNLCQEIAEPVIQGEQTACCNLMSICLSKFVVDKKFDFLSFARSVRFCVFLLNEVINSSHGADPLIRKSNEMIRPIGIGVNGFFDMMALMDLSFLDPTSVSSEPNLWERYSKDPNNILKYRLSPVLHDLVKKIWSCMYFNALKASNKLVKIYGKYGAFDSSPYTKGKLQFHFWQEEEKELGRKYPFSLTPDDPLSWGQKGSWKELTKKIQKEGLTNSLHLTIMPTATSAQILDVCESIEQHTQNIYVRRLMTGDILIMNYHMVGDLQALGLWNQETYDNIVLHDGSILYLPEDGFSDDHLGRAKLERLRYLKEKYRTMWELPQRLRMILTAQMQVFIDQSISFNLYLDEVDANLLVHILHYGWKLGLKSLVYYTRSKASASALKIGYQGPGKDSSLVESKGPKKEIPSDVPKKNPPKQDPKKDMPQDLPKKDLVKFPSKDENFTEIPKEKDYCSRYGSECLSCQV